LGEIFGASSGSLQGLLRRVEGFIYAQSLTALTTIVVVVKAVSLDEPLLGQLFIHNEERLERTEITADIMERVCRYLRTFSNTSELP
jgi:hypothetical protein